MSPRSSITARQMETCAHGQAIADELGIERREDDRIRNIVILGVNTFSWSLMVRGMEMPEGQPALRFTLPSGESWEYGNHESDQVISGMAHECAQAVTQTRNIADTQLVWEGDTAELWMRNAQCFAGAAAKPLGCAAHQIPSLSESWLLHYPPISSKQADKRESSFFGAGIPSPPTAMSSERPAQRNNMVTDQIRCD